MDIGVGAHIGAHICTHLSAGTGAVTSPSGPLDDVDKPLDVYCDDARASATSLPYSASWSLPFSEVCWEALSSILSWMSWNLRKVTFLGKGKGKGMLFLSRVPFDS